jgi:pSer/pThr/pTyr-binding forkhead associated (FHA) protein
MSAPPTASRTTSGRSRLFGLRYRTRVLLLGPGTIQVGRQTGCELRLPDARVSRRHARIIVGDQTAAVEDLGSANGVIVNGKRVEGLRRLSGGDKIQIGEQIVEVIGFSDAHDLGGGADGADSVTFTGPLERLIASDAPVKYDDETDVTNGAPSRPTRRPPRAG